MIPKIIHYCWFGGNPLPEMAEKCIASWKRFCPEYEIKRWDETNFDINCCRYTAEAYQVHKWAFVSDYARVWILYHEGGIYLDTDVELIKPLDEIAEHGAFMGTEKRPRKGMARLQVNSGLGLGAEAGHPFYKKILEMYEKRQFLFADGNMDLKTVVDTVSEILQASGLQSANILQTVEGIRIYPEEYFCPLAYNTGQMEITDKTVSIHWYDASWFDELLKKRRKVCLVIRKKIKNQDMAENICKLYMKVSYAIENIRKGRALILIRKKIGQIKR